MEEELIDNRADLAIESATSLANRGTKYNQRRMAWFVKPYLSLAPITNQKSKRSHITKRYLNDHLYSIGQNWSQKH